MTYSASLTTLGGASLAATMARTWVVPSMEIGPVYRGEDAVGFEPSVV